MKNKKERERDGEAERGARRRKGGEECGICPPDFPSVGRMCKKPH